MLLFLKSRAAKIVLCTFAIVVVLVIIIFDSPNWNERGRLTHDIVRESRNILKGYVLSGYAPPETTRWEDLVNEIDRASSNEDWGYTSGSTSFRRGVDSWGQPLTYFRQVENQTYTIIVRSVGRNGVDESGDGDDIEARWTGELRPWR